VALAVHEVYYRVLIAQAHRSAMEARIKASQDLASERIEQVKFGSSLEQESIESRGATIAGKARTPDDGSSVGGSQVETG